MARRAKLLSGEQLDAREQALFAECTGRSRLPSKPVRRMVLLAGRRAGKDRFLSAVAVFAALFKSISYRLASLAPCC